MTSAAELNGKVYVAVDIDGTGNEEFAPLMYDCYKDKWTVLPKLPHNHVFFSLVTASHKKQLLAIGGLTSSNKVSNKVFAWDEDNKRWTTPYPNMPTARCHSTCISYGSVVIVASGAASLNRLKLTGAVEVLHTEPSSGTKSYWSVVEPLPHVVCEAVPLLIGDKLYVVSGYDINHQNTCDIVTASIPELLQSSNKKTGNVWHKIPDMPYSSWSIIHYQGRLIILNGDHLVEQSGKRKPAWELVLQSHLYNPSTKSWDYVGNDFHNYKLGKSVYIGDKKIFFIGGETGTFCRDSDDMVKTCFLLTLTPK